MKSASSLQNNIPEPHDDAGERTCFDSGPGTVLVHIACDDFPAALAFYVDELGFRIDSIFPADGPRAASLSGFGIRLRIENSRRPESATPVDPALVVARPGAGEWGAGRAGMQYRDLIPGRYGGRFIASHIRIVEGGEVADYVHHHDVDFQVICCVRGWVRVVYEDQGPVMTMEAGDCLLQPPGIRHRVLESSDHMEVLEFTCPAEHETGVDHELVLPTATLEREREFSGQRFVFHQAKKAAWSPPGGTVGEIHGHRSQWEYRDTAIAAATRGLVSVIDVKPAPGASELALQHNGEIRFLFVLAGSASLDGHSEGRRQLMRGYSCAIPPHLRCELKNVSTDFRMLEIFVPSRS